MNVAVAEGGAPALPDTLARRLGALGLAALRLTPDGGAHPAAALSQSERAIIHSRWFRRGVSDGWDRLCEAPGQPVELWEGLWLSALPTARRRRAADSAREPMWAVMLLGARLPRSEQFLAACHEHQLDHAAAVSLLDPARLMSDAEARRLSAAIGWMADDAREVTRWCGDTQELSRELAESYEELSLLYKLSTRLTVDQPPAAFLDEACRELQQVVGLDWLAVQIVHDEQRLQELAGRLFIAGTAAARRKQLAAIGRDVLRRFEGEHEPVIFDDIAPLHLPELQRLSADLLVVPLRCDGRLIGLLMGGGGGKRGGGQLTTGDSKLCAALASSITIFLQNRMLFEDVQSMFLGTLHALTSAIDAKDSYTHGHSERVAMMSRMLAQQMGLDALAADRVYLAGLVHDVGKIGVPEAVLGKPGRLTDDEFALIRLHPEIGARIIRDVPQMQDLIPGVLHHHEKWNGRGYPHGLKGEEIPLFGRIIGLADAFDAMSSDRTYRAGLRLDNVLAEIRKCSGTQFDPALADGFVQLDFEPYFRLIRKHQQRPAAA